VTRSYGWAGDCRLPTESTTAPVQFNPQLVSSPKESALTAAVNIEHSIERSSAFVTIVLGELVYVLEPHTVLTA